jgi:hypothetical protein
MTYKGLDDLLAAGGKPRRLRGAEVDAFFAQARAQLFAPLTPGWGAGPAPVPAELEAERPPFPAEVFPTRVANFVRRVSAAMACPVDFPALGALVVSASAVGAARSLEVKGGWAEKPGMYAVIVSKPGTTKTPALRTVMAPIYEAQDRLHEEHKAAVRKYREDMEAYRQAAQAPEAGGPPPERPAEPGAMPHLFAVDTTTEALARNLLDNRKGILVFRDEASGWVRSLDMYRSRGADRQLYLSLWSAELLKVDRRGHHDQPIIIPHPCVSVLGGIQPDLLGELEDEGGREDGFVHRILFSYPPEGKIPGWVDDELTEEDQLGWQLVLGRLLNLRPVKPEGSSERPKALRLSPEGRQAFQEFCDGLAGQMNDADFPPELVGPCSKLKSYCVRFALVLHLLRVACDEAGGGHDEGQVDAEDVGNAMKLCDYFRAHFRAVYLRLQQTREDRQVEGLLRWLRRKGKASCTVRELCRSNVSGVRRASEAQRLLAAAVDQGLGDWQGGTVKGGPEVKRAQYARETPAFVLKG